MCLAALSIGYFNSFFPVLFYSMECTFFFLEIIGTRTNTLVKASIEYASPKWWTFNISSMWLTVTLSLIQTLRWFEPHALTPIPLCPKDILYVISPLHKQNISFVCSILVHCLFVLKRNSCSIPVLLLPWDFFRTLTHLPNKDRPLRNAHTVHTRLFIPRLYADLWVGLLTKLVCFPCVNGTWHSYPRQFTTRATIAKA